LRTLLLHREDEPAAELAAARDGLKEQVVRNEHRGTERLVQQVREIAGRTREPADLSRVAEP
jgi:hypothetical protein